VLLTLNLNDTILQKENAFIFQQITCGKAALCYTKLRICSTGILACVIVLWKASAEDRWKVAIILYVAASSLAITLGGRNLYSAFISMWTFVDFSGNAIFLWPAARSFT
jgi:hypothetical protein